MGRLRKTIQRSIHDILDSSIFTSEDFTVSFGDPDSNEYLIYIEFNYDKSFSYGISKSVGMYYVTKSPGDVTESEQISHRTYEDSISYIHQWCHEVRNELKATQPIYKEVDNLKKLLEENIIFGNNSTEKEFSVEEIYNLQKKFEDLQVRVEQLEKDKIITESQSKDINKGLQQVKEDVEYYPKETWIKTSTNKVLNLFVSIGKSQEGRKVLADGTRKLLGLE